MLKREARACVGRWNICRCMLVMTGAQEGIRTPTPLREADFKSAASTVPPPGQDVYTDACPVAYYMTLIPLAESLRAPRVGRIGGSLRGVATQDLTGRVGWERERRP